MASTGSHGSNIGSKTFSPDDFLEKWSRGDIEAPQNNDLQRAVNQGWQLKKDDDYVYHAVASVTLAQVQHAIGFGGQHGMHAWYSDDSGSQIPPPPQPDIDAYISIFASTTSTTKALIALEKNAKKGSIRASVAAHLINRRVFPATVQIPKLKAAHVNPSMDYWAWSCKNLEWAGPDDSTVNVKQSHHILPILYHHFGCVCPTFESLEAIRQLAKGRAVIEAGSGNGYWAYMLRRLGLTVDAIDNGDSIWRTMWIGDTIKADAAAYLRKRNGGMEAVLLMVYPQVMTQFTTSVLEAYSGSTICVAGTQNANGFTAFKDVIIDQYMGSRKPEYQKIMQTPLPSFAGKDEAFFVFQKS